MPNIKSAKKRVLVNEKKAQANKAIKSALKTQIKKFLAAVSAGDKETAEKLYPETVSAIDAAATKGVIHKNNANNKKAKIAKKLNSLNA
ncbi:MAG: 30S ribosomal protein S20 [Clostridia bacterium]|nr:30S ribosomal protein S20 [Clostridia bacterium]